MMLYFFLIAVFTLLLAGGIVLSIFGLLRRRRKLLVTAILMFAVGIAGCVFATWVYTNKAINYVTSQQFQDDARKGSEFIGKTMGSAASGAANGLSATLDDEAIKNLANKSGTILGKSIKTMASGLDSTLGNKNIFIDKALENSGLELGRAEERFTSDTANLEVFINYKKHFKGTIKITNYDQNGRKIEVADKAIHAKAGQEKVEVFNFVHSDLGITTYYILSKAE